MYDSEPASPSVLSETFSDDSDSIVLPLSSKRIKPGVSSVAGVLRCELIGHLEKCEESGSFQTHGVIISPPNPGLTIHGVGLIPLPLCEDHVGKICERARQNAIDEGKETPAEAEDQNMWQLDKSAFETTNPTWQTWIENTTRRIRLPFSIHGASVTAELNKLCLYKEGAFVKPHTDSEKVPGMFGTLVVCLPSKHEGGDIRMVYNSEERAFSTAKCSQFDQSYVAWFADVTHEMKSVTSGYKFVLTYNLVMDLPSQDLPSAKTVVATTAELHEILNRWRSGGEKMPKKMAYILHHKYPNASLKLQSLKGTDLPKVKHLQRVAEECGFRLLLARVIRAVEGECEAYSDDDSLDSPHELLDVNETTLKLDQVTHLDGTQVAANIKFNEDELVPQNYFDYENKPDHEDLGRHGSSGGKSTHWWHRTAVLILTEREHFSIVTRGAMNDESKIRALITDAHRRVYAGSSSEERQELTQLCKSVISAYQDSHVVHNSTSKSKDNAEVNLGGLSDDVIGLVIETALDVEDSDLVDEAARAIKREFPSKTWLALGRKASTGSLSARSSLLSILLRLPTLQSVSTCLAHIFHAVASADAEIEWFTAWMSCVMTEKTNSISNRLTGADGSILAKIASDWGDIFLSNFVETLTSETLTNSAFLVSFGIALSRYMNPLPTASECRLSVTVARQTIYQIMTVLSKGFSMDSFASQILNKSMATATPHSFPVGAKAAPVKVRQSVRPIAELYKCGMDHGMHDVANGMLEAIATNLATRSSIESATIENVPMLLLQDLSVVCKEYLLTQPVFQKLFRNTFTALSTHWVLEQPTEPDLCHPRVGCASACPDCVELDRFLMNPRQKSAEFKLRGQRKLHIEHRLYRTQHKRGFTPRGKFAVTKADSESEKIAALAKSRRERGRAFVNSFDQSDLRSLLGDRYDELTSLEHKKPPLPAADLSSAGGNSEDTAVTEGATRFGNSISPNIIGNPTRPASSQPLSNPLKRKADDVIDISDNPPSTSHISSKTQ